MGTGSHSRVLVPCLCGIINCWWYQHLIQRYVHTACKILVSLDCPSDFIELPPHNNLLLQTVQNIEKAIRESPLQLNPRIEGEEVLVPVPRSAPSAMLHPLQRCLDSPISQ